MRQFIIITIILITIFVLLYTNLGRGVSFVEGAYSFTDTDGTTISYTINTPGDPDSVMTAKIGSNVSRYENYGRQNANTKYNVFVLGVMNSVKNATGFDFSATMDNIDGVKHFLYTRFNVDLITNTNLPIPTDNSQLRNMLTNFANEQKNLGYTSVQQLIYIDENIQTLTGIDTDRIIIVPPPTTAPPTPAPFIDIYANLIDMNNIMNTAIHFTKTYHELSTGSALISNSQALQYVNANTELQRVCGYTPGNVMPTETQYDCIAKYWVVNYRPKVFDGMANMESSYLLLSPGQQHPVDAKEPEKISWLNDLANAMSKYVWGASSKTSNIEGYDSIGLFRSSALLRQISSEMNVPITNQNVASGLPVFMRAAQECGVRIDTINDTDTSPTSLKMFLANLKSLNITNVAGIKSFSDTMLAKNFVSIQSELASSMSTLVSYSLSVSSTSFTNYITFIESAKTFGVGNITTLNAFTSSMKSAIAYSPIPNIFTTLTAFGVSSGNIDAYINVIKRIGLSGTTNPTFAEYTKTLTNFGVTMQRVTPFLNMYNMNNAADINILIKACTDYGINNMTSPDFVPFIDMCNAYRIGKIYEAPSVAHTKKVVDELMKSGWFSNYTQQKTFLETWTARVGDFRLDDIMYVPEINAMGITKPVDLDAMLSELINAGIDVPHDNIVDALVAWSKLNITKTNAKSILQPMSANLGATGKNFGAGLEEFSTMNVFGNIMSLFGHNAKNSVNEPLTSLGAYDSVFRNYNPFGINNVNNVSTDVNGNPVSLIKFNEFVISIGITTIDDYNNMIHVLKNYGVRSVNFYSFLQTLDQFDVVATQASGRNTWGQYIEFINRLTRLNITYQNFKDFFPAMIGYGVRYSDFSAFLNALSNFGVSYSDTIDGNGKTTQNTFYPLLEALTKYKITYKINPADGTNLFLATIQNLIYMGYTCTTFLQNYPRETIIDPVYGLDTSIPDITKVRSTFGYSPGINFQGKELTGQELDKDRTAFYDRFISLGPQIIDLDIMTSCMSDNLFYRAQTRGFTMMDLTQSVLPLLISYTRNNLTNKYVQYNSHNTLINMCVIFPSYVVMIVNGSKLIANTRCPSINLTNGFSKDCYKVV